MKLSELIRNFKYVNIDGKGANTPIDQVDKKELAVGIAVEREHGSDINRAMSIALDHLSENEKYYSILVKSGLVDEPKALDLAKQYLYIDMNKNNDDEDLTNILLGFNPLNKRDYTN